MDFEQEKTSQKLELLILWEVVRGEMGTGPQSESEYEVQRLGNSNNNCKYLWSIYHVLVGLTDGYKFL